MSKNKLVIGLDFDNTLVSYDEAMHQTAVEMGFTKGITAVHKQQVRDQIRSLPDGELKWQKLQAEVYGNRMDRARLIEGVEPFVRACRNERIRTFIVSHKSKYAAQDIGKVDLQAAALQWMKQNHFFDKDGLGLSEECVYFESSREDKANRIKKLECTHFIDDLEEFFLEGSFPQGTKRMLYSPQSGSNSNTSPSAAGIEVFRSWGDIHNYFFNKS